MADDFPVTDDMMTTMIKTKDELLRDMMMMTATMRHVDGKELIRRLRGIRRLWTQINENPQHMGHDDDAMVHAMREWFRRKIQGSRDYHYILKWQRFCDAKAHEYISKRTEANMTIVVFFNELVASINEAILNVETELEIGAKFRAKLYARSIRRARNKWATKRVTCPQCGKEHLQSNKTKHERTQFHKNACKKEENIRLVVVEKTL
jgi:hypothetical protein